MEHDQKVCPRCGKPAGEYRFCGSCRSHFEVLVGIPTPAVAHASEPSHAAAHGPRELIAAADGGSDRSTGGAPAAAVEVAPDPHVADEQAAETSAPELAKLPSTAGDRLSEASPAQREVARFEDLLTIVPEPEAEPASVDADDPTADAVAAAAVEAVELAARRRDIDWARLRREVARLDDLLSLARTDAGDGVETPLPEVVSEPVYLAADALRAAFWYEQASAFKSNGERERPASQPPPAPKPEVEPAPAAADSRIADLQPEARPRSITRLWLDQASDHPRVATACLLALIGLVAMLTGRDLRRFIGRPAR